jgi:phenylalanyl-tRNA synthetase beta subunit
VLPHIDFKPQINGLFYKTLYARKKLMDDGFREVATYSLTKKGVVELARATKGKEKLRTNLLDGLKDSYELNKLNAPLLGVSEIKIFEIGNVFLEKGVEETHVAYMDNGGGKEMTLEEFTKDMEIGNSYEELLSTFNSKLSTEEFKMWSQYPFIVRDIAVWVPKGTDSSILIEVYTDLGGELLACPPMPFDTFSKDRKTSLGFRLIFQAQDRTLTDEEVNKIMSDITKEISKTKDFVIR